MIIINNVRVYVISTFSMWFLKILCIADRSADPNRKNPPFRISGLSFVELPFFFKWLTTHVWSSLKKLKLAWIRILDPDPDKVSRCESKDNSIALHSEDIALIQFFKYMDPDPYLCSKMYAFGQFTQRIISVFNSRLE